MSRPRPAALAGLLTSVLAAAASAAPTVPESSVRVLLSGGLSPFASVRYEVFARDDTPVVVHARELAGRDEALLRTALLTPEEYRALWDALLAVELFALQPSGPPALPGGPTATIEAAAGAQQLRLVVADPEARDDPRLAAVVRAVRGVAEAHAGVLPFRDVFHPRDTLGWLDLSSTPLAAVRIDGRDTSETTPLSGYELPAGRHILDLRDPRTGEERRYDVTIEAGMTTVLRLELR